MGWYLAEAILCPVAIRSYSSREYLVALGSVAFCFLSFECGYRFLERRSKPNPDSGFFSGLANSDVVWQSLLVCSLIGFLPLLVVSKGDLWLILVDAFEFRPRWSSVFQRGRYGDARDALLELQMFLRAATPLAAAILIGRSSTWLRRMFSAGLLAYLIARAFHDGSRLKLVEVLLPVAAATYWVCAVTVRRKLVVWMLPMALIIGFLWSAAAVQGRDAGRFRWSDAFTAQYTGFEMFRELLFLQREVRAHSPWQWGYTYYVQAVNPVPRILWPGKPVGDAGLQLAHLQKAVVNGEPMLTIAPGVIGEMYWNFGITGIVVLSALFGVACCWWDRLRVLGNQSLPIFAVFSSGLFIIFATGRSVNLSNLYGLVALWGTIHLVCRVSSMRREVS